MKNKWIILFLIILAPSMLWADRIPEITEDYHTRQIQSLADIAGKVTSSTSEQGAALLLLNQDIEEANQKILHYQGEESSLMDCSLILRILLELYDEPEILYPKTQEQLEWEINHFITINTENFLKRNPQDYLSESQEILLHSNFQLWAQYIGSVSDAYQWPDGSSNDDRYVQHLEGAHHWLDQRGLYGFEERSSAYYIYDMAALLNLRDFAEDENLRLKADAVIDLMLADIALESLNGYWGGARCRSFEAVAPLPGNRLHYIMFDSPLPLEHHSIHPVMIHLGHTEYQPPPVLVRLGNEWYNRGSYEIKKLYCVDRQNPDESGIGRNYSYVTPDYILGSFQLRNQRVPWQARAWDLLLKDENGKGYHLFTFVGNQTFSGGEPPFENEFFLWNATCFQHKNVLFSTYHRSDRKRAGIRSINQRVDTRLVQQPTRVWIPEALTPLEREGPWWFVEVGNVYLAFRPLQGNSYWWRSAFIGLGEMFNASLLSFQDLYTGFLLEVEQKSNFSSFDHFKNQILSAPLEIKDNWATYVSQQGDVYTFSLDGGDFLVNGIKNDPWNDPEYDLYSSPFTQSEYGSGIFQAQWEPYSLLINLSVPELPKRIIQ